MNTLNVTGQDGNEYTITMTSLIEATIKPMNPVRINGIVYTVHTWVKWGYDKWIVRDVYTRRDGDAFAGPTDAASSALWASMKQIVTDHIEGNEALIEGGRVYGIQTEINRLEEEVAKMQEEIQDKKDAIASALEDLEVG